MGATVAAKNRKVRQDALREFLSKKCTVQQLIDNIQKFESLGDALDATEVNRLKIATDTRIKLLGKYLPDLKSVEMTGEGGEPIKAVVEWSVQPVKPVDET